MLDVLLILLLPSLIRLVMKISFYTFSVTLIQTMPLLSLPSLRDQILFLIMIRTIFSSLKSTKMNCCILLQQISPVFANLSTKSSQHAPNFSAGLLPSPPQHTINWGRGCGRTNFFGRGRRCQNRCNSSFSYSSSLSNVPRVVCQICNKAPAIRCYKRFDLVPSLLPPTRQLCMLLPPPTLI